MRYVNVIIVAPDQSEYEGKIDADASDTDILDDVAEAMEINRHKLLADLSELRGLKKQPVVRLFYSKLESELNLEED